MLHSPPIRILPPPRRVSVGGGDAEAEDEEVGSIGGVVRKRCRSTSQSNARIRRIERRLKVILLEVVAAVVFPTLPPPTGVTT